MADVGEEGEGNLRGMRALAEAYKKRLKYVIALDGSATEYVTTAALASRRVEITITGPGGHSWSDFGAPNPIHAHGAGNRALCHGARAGIAAHQFQYRRDRRRHVGEFHSRQARI